MSDASDAPIDTPIPTTALLDVEDVAEVEEASETPAAPQTSQVEETSQAEETSYEASQVEETSEVEEAPEADEANETPGIGFAELGLPADLVRELDFHEVRSAFPVQAATIPDALAGRDVLGRARTGSGKTLAFGLPMLARLEGRRARRTRPLALILVPTRELAMQVADAVRPYARAVGLRVACAFGGAPIFKQIDALRYGVEVLVATPGRLGDLIERQACSLDEIQITVLDEADEMADMGFLPEVRALLDQTPAGGQRLLFSATLDGAVDELVTAYLTDPARHEIVSDAEETGTMSHHLLVVEPRDKAVVTAQIAARHGMSDENRTMLFVRTKLAVDRIVGQLRDAGLPVAGLHGAMSQRARTRTLAEFREGRVPVLVATDVAARGIHVDGIDLVVHIDPTNDPKDYLHRAGRTARAGESGTVATLVLPKQRKATQRLMEMAGVVAPMTRVRPGDAALAELTGARSVDEYLAERAVYDAEQEKRREEDRARRGTERPSRGDRPGYDRPRGDRPYRSRDDRRPYRDDRSGYGRSYGDRPYGDRPRFDRPRDENGGDARAAGRIPEQSRAPRDDRRPYGDDRRPYRDRDDRPARRDDRRDDRFQRDDRPRREYRDWSDDRPRGRDDRPGYGRPASGDRTDRPRRDDDRPRRFGGDRERSYGDRPSGDGRFGDRPSGDRRFGDRPSGDRPSSDRPSGERSSGERPSGERPYGERRFGDRPSGDRPYRERSFGSRPYGERSTGDRPSGDRDRPYRAPRDGAPDRSRGHARPRRFDTDGPRNDRPYRRDRDAR